ncbi:MAG: FmdB family transcriptional regulator [Desulfobacteraceae bacterium 4572_89]|nr:MAG: FmdB family transcriptional regulator [Desulfobacteraceae bacterium 4572_89]
MPVYEYECVDCGRIEEAFQKISESPLEVCPQCKGHLKKLISHSTFHLKGSGWYVTDYGGKKTGSSTKEKSTSKSADATSGKSSTTSDKASDSIK